MTGKGQGKETPSRRKTQVLKPMNRPEKREERPLVPPSPPSVNLNNRGRRIPDAKEQPEMQPNLEENPVGHRGRQRGTSTRRGCGRGPGRRTPPDPQVAVRPSLSPSPPAVDLDCRGRGIPDANEQPEMQPNLEENPVGHRGRQRGTSTRRGCGRGPGRRTPPDPQVAVRPSLSPSPPAVDLDCRGRGIPDANEQPEMQPNLEENPVGHRGRHRGTSTRRGCGRGPGRRTPPDPQVAVRPSLSPSPPAVDLDCRGRGIPDANEQPEMQPNLEENPVGHRGRQRGTSTRRGCGRGPGRRTPPDPQVAVRPSLSPSPPAVDLDCRGRGIPDANEQPEMQPNLEENPVGHRGRHRGTSTRRGCGRGPGRRTPPDPQVAVRPSLSPSPPAVDLDCRGRGVRGPPSSAPYLSISRKWKPLYFGQNRPRFPFVGSYPLASPWYRPPGRDFMSQLEPQSNRLQLLNVGEQSVELEKQSQSDVQLEPNVQPDFESELGELDVQQRPEPQTDPLQILDVSEMSVEPETQPQSQVQLEPNVQPEVATEPDLQHEPPQQELDKNYILSLPRAWEYLPFVGFPLSSVRHRPPGRGYLSQPEPQPNSLQTAELGDQSAEPETQSKSEVPLKPDVRPEAIEPVEHLQPDLLQILDAGEQSSKPKIQSKSEIHLEPGVQSELAKPESELEPSQKLDEQPQPGEKPNPLQILDVGEQSSEPETQPKSEVQLEPDVQPEVATEPDSQPHGQELGEQLRPESQQDPLQVLDVSEQSEKPEIQPKSEVQIEPDVQPKVATELDSQHEQPQKLVEQPQPDLLQIIDVGEKSKVQLEPYVKLEAEKPESQLEPSQELDEPGKKPNPLQIHDLGKKSAEPGTQPKSEVQLEPEVQPEVSTEPDSQPETPQELGEQIRPELQQDPLQVLDVGEQSKKPETQLTLEVEPDVQPELATEPDSQHEPPQELDEQPRPEPDPLKILDVGEHSAEPESQPKSEQIDVANGPESQPKPPQELDEHSRPEPQPDLLQIHDIDQCKTE